MTLYPWINVIHSVIINLKVVFCNAKRSDDKAHRVEK